MKHSLGFINKFFIVFIVPLACLCILIFKVIPPEPPQFQDDTFNFASKQKPLFESYIIPQPKFLLSAHSSTFDVLPSGELLAFWFAGSHEGKPDVKIWSSSFTNSKWSLAKAVVSPALLSQDLDRYIKKVGNPVIYRAANGKLHLFVVSVSIGGWSGSTLNHLISEDDGKTWQRAKKLMLSPFLNLSTLNRTKAIALRDGGFYLPVYHELIYTYPELLRFDKDGNFVMNTRMTSTHHFLQPAILVTSKQNAQAFLRNNAKRDDYLYRQLTTDGGLSWTQPKPTNLTNHDSSLVVSNLGTQFLMVYNTEERSKLILALSNDGYTWKDIAYLENTPNMEFSYPSIQVHGTGIVDILYTWDRKYIKHVRFNLTWLINQQQRTHI